MHELFWEIHKVMNLIKGFIVGYSATDGKMMFDYKGKRWVAEFREIENPKEDMVDDMRRIKYL
jgi:hypothetical protein